MLRAWHATRWAAMMGRAPEPDDHVLPAVRGRGKGKPRNTSASNRAFKADQGMLGIAPARHQHCARDTLISLAQDDGADPAVLERITHCPAAERVLGLHPAELGAGVPGTGEVENRGPNGDSRGDTARVVSVKRTERQRLGWRKHRGIEPPDRSGRLRAHRF